MSDPAYEAARRADDIEPDLKQPDRFGEMVEAAREALKPVRRIVEDWEATGNLDYEALLKSIFTTEELEKK